ncbi:MAG: NADH-quinone oxidoreductase subunit M [Planctomycetota bacterium]|nr:NADH-quinone oxidoreductase subunit M [Planctomycetota bacterium]MCZ6698667.1 NADH-quinone oxidoreductase subunit M [Planctomycetota bacterium]
MFGLEDTFLGEHILSVVIFLPILGSAVIFAQRSSEPSTVRRWAMGFSIVTLLAALLAAGLYATEWATPGEHRLVERLSWMGTDDAASGGVQLQYHVGVDGISLPLLLLTALLTPLAIWSSFSSIQTRAREYYALMLLLHGSMLGVFCAHDLLVFYVFFEFTLVPLYFIIGIWGGPDREKAANMFFIYTLAGSMLTFAGVLYLGWLGSQHALGPNGLRVFSFDFDRLYELAAAGHLTASVQGWLFIAFFAGFAIKVPLFPLHTWLPPAHTEAPTAGSVILAGVLLKLGTYGFLRLSLPMLPASSVSFAPIVGSLAVIGIIYGAVAAWVQSDIKKLVAYSSVSHLGFCLLGMFSLTTAGLTGSVLYMINHGLSTGALFLVVGMIYERYHTREMEQIGGLAKKMPIMAFFLIVFTLSSIGLPGLNGFVSEFLVLLGTFTSTEHLGIPFAVPAATGIVLGAVYMLHMARRVLFGPLKEPGHGFDASAGLTQDLTRREIAILTPIAALCLLLGVYPKPLIEVMEPSLVAIIRTVEASGSEAVAMEGSQRPGEESTIRRSNAFVQTAGGANTKPTSESVTGVRSKRPTDGMGKLPDGVYADAMKPAGRQRNRARGGQ